MTKFNSLGQEVAKSRRAQDFKRWCFSFLAENDPILQRSGGVCPFIASAIKNDTITISYVTDEYLGSYAGICRNLKDIILAWDAHVSTIEKTLVPISAHVVFFDEAPYSTVDFKLLKKIKSAWKDEVMKLGYTLGVLYPNSND